jgi:hypothetical protein
MDPKTKKNLSLAIIAIGSVIVLFIILILTSPVTSKQSTRASNKTGSTPAPAIVTNDIANVPESTLNSIGVGTANQKPRPIKAPALTANNKPEILYEGAEYCPYCATERWAMSVALAKFGTFSHLGITHSSTTDVYPNTQTLSFYKSTYTSNYLTFTSIEMYTNIPNGNGGYTTLQTPTKNENNIINRYDASPYVPAQYASAIPFIDLGGKFLIAGATYSPQVLHGKSATQIASSLSSVNSPIAKGADGAANTIIAAICKITNNQPQSACTPLIKKIESTL